MASVRLDTIEPQDSDFQAHLTDNNITMGVIQAEGPCGVPDVLYTAESAATLEELIDMWFGDDDLKDMITE